MRKLSKLISLLLSALIILSGCSIINVHKYTTMYIDAFTFKENIQYSKYVEVSVETFNDTLNTQIYTTLLTRATTNKIEFNEEEHQAISEAVTQFRENEVKIVLINANEKESTATVKVYISNAYPLFISDLKENVTTVIESEEYKPSIIESMTHTLKNAKIEDSVEIDIVIKTDEISGKYYISKKSQENIIAFVLGLN